MCSLPKIARDSFFDQICVIMLLNVVFFLIWHNVRLNMMSNFCVNNVLVKCYGLFISMTFTATISFYHYPAAMINIVILFPLIHNSIGLFGRSIKEPLTYSRYQTVFSHLCFLICLLLAVCCMFGTVIFEKDSFNIKSGSLKKIYRDMLQIAMEDLICAGSNIWIYICLLYLPNLLLIIQI